MSQAVKGTRGSPAQRELLGWLVERETRHLENVRTWFVAEGHTDQHLLHARERQAREINASGLISYYKQRKEAANPEFSAQFPGQARGGYANHGWRRAGGTALKRLVDRGFLKVTGSTTYSLTDEGRAIGTEVNSR